MVDLLAYLRGDGRLYELVNNQGSSEVVQTQTEPKNVFYHVKNSKWEELWADPVYIYRGTDTSSDGEIYSLSENNHYGSAWVPRFLDVGGIFRRSPTVTWRNKATGAVSTSQPPATHVTWIKFAKLHDQLKFTTTLTLPDVVELQAFVDNGGTPADAPWEKYFYARGYGLVAFDDMYGGFRSWISQTFTPAIMPQRVREVIPWLAALQKRYYLPDLPTETATGTFTLSKLPSNYVNVRAYPVVDGQDVGDLHKGDIVKLHAPEVNGWVYVQNNDVQGWVSRQNGNVEFTVPSTEPPPTDPPPDTGGGDPIPPDDGNPPPTVVQWPGSIQQAIQMRDAYKALEANAHAIWTELDDLIKKMGV